MGGKTLTGVLAEISQRATTRPARQFIQNVRTLHEGISRARDEGKDRGFINRLQAEGRAAVTASLRAELAAERARLAEELRKERGRYEAAREKDLARVDVRARMAERRYAGMTDAELRKYTKPDALPLDPDNFDALSAELVTRGFVTDHETVRGLGEKARVHEPWTRTENGAAISRELELCADVRGTGTLLDYGGGKTGSTDFDLLWELLTDAKEADDAE